MRTEWGVWSVISISFANAKAGNFEAMKEKMFRIFANAARDHGYLWKSDRIDDYLKSELSNIRYDMTQATAEQSVNTLARALNEYYNKKILIFFGEYDTPIQEAWLSGFYDEMVDFIRSLFNSTFKTNPHLQSAVITGITRVSKESIFSDMNNLTVCTVTSDKYSTAFGFTKDEVIQALGELGMDDEYTREEVKQMYDGFTFGSVSDIYNPWSLSNYFEEKKPMV